MNHNRLISFVLSLCLCINAIPLTASASWNSAGTDFFLTASDIKTGNDEGNDSPIDIGALITGNNQTVNNLIIQAKFSARNGHGFAAERANNLIDTLLGMDASVVGDNNVKNGPDRLILGRFGSKTWIQDKYYANAASGIEACFENGSFRYYDADGNPMQIEVPRDQYETAVECMRQKILEGQIDGITDPDEAASLVRRGNLTYRQAVNVAKAGTVESLLYDAATGTVSALCGFGISAVLNYAVLRLNGEEHSEALKEAALTGLKTGGIVFATSVIASQLSRTNTLQIFAPSAEALTQALGPSFSKALLNSVGKETAGMTTEAVTKYAAKVLRNQGLTAAITIVILTADDVVNLFRGRISTNQLVKNLTVTSAGVVGGYVGSAIGGTLGSALVPGLGTTMGSIAGAVVIGGASGLAAEKLTGIYIREDAEEMLEILSSTFEEIAGDYLISQEEADRIVDKLNANLTSGTLKLMYASKDRAAFARTMIEPFMEEEAKARNEIAIPSEQELRAELKESLTDVVYIH